MMRILKKWFGKETAGQVMNPVCHEAEAVVTKTEKPASPSPMLERLEAHLFDRYDFRFNVLTEQSEYAPKGKEHYQLVDQRTLNTFCIEARAAGINCWDKDVSRLLCSQKIADFHPFTYYMEHLPKWDGIDRVTPLAQRVSDTPVWVNGFHRWMLAMTATEIFCRLQKKFPAALRGSNASQMGKTLQALGVRHTHTRQGDAYLVVPV